MYKGNSYVIEKYIIENILYVNLLQKYETLPTITHKRTLT